jgi:hypothetical protein
MFPHAVHAMVASERSDQMVVEGLIEARNYNTVNMYRPGFTFTLSWGDRQSAPLYQAFTPLVSDDVFERGAEQLGYGNTVSSAKGTPRTGVIRAVTPGGSPVNLVHHRDTARARTKTVDSLEVPFGRGDIDFSLHTDGTIRVVDGRRKVHILRVENWPYIRGNDG